tara:strand:+ start:128 stop:1444 length:1317 start_codon:yes stop_codon:yes gene_type:complete
MNNFLNSVDNNPLEELKIFSGRFISIGVLAKYPERLKEYLEDLEINCFDKKNFEVVVVIPDDEEVQKNFINAVSKIKLKIRIERLPYGYLNSMKSHNMMIEKFSDQNTYFYINNSDRVRFACKNWDLIIKQYINCVPDDMFFLRGSNFSKNMKPRKSVQDAYYNPEQWGVFSRKYLNAIGGFLESHTAHDGACEMIQYFIGKNKKDLFQRDILMPNIMHSDKRTISSKNTTGKQTRFYERYYINNFFYKSYFTKKGLELCKKASVRVFLKHLIWKKNYTSAIIIQKGKFLGIKLSDNKIVDTFSYKVNFFEYIREKYFYLFGINHGLNFVHRFYFILKYKKGFMLISKIVFFLNSHIQNVKTSKENNNSDKISYLFYYLSNFLTFIFVTEPISNELEGLFRGDDFKNVLHGNIIKEAYKSKLYNKSLENIAQELEKKI